MKKTMRVFALLLAALMMITSFAALALAEGEETETSGDSSNAESGGESSGGESSGGETSGGETSGGESSGEDTPKITASIVINGAPADSVNVYFNDTAVSGTYTGAPGAVAIRVEPKDGYEITSAEYKIPYLGAVKLTEANGNYSATTYELSDGASFTLTVNVKVIPKQVALSVSANGNDVFVVKANGTEVDLTEYGVMTGDEIEITFEGEGEFDPELALLTVNNVVTEMTSFTYKFVINEDTKIVFYYGELPVTVDLKGPVKLEFRRSSDDTLIDTVTNNGTGTVNKVLLVERNVEYKIIVTPGPNYEIVGGVRISETNRAVRDGVYYFTPKGATVVSVVMKKTDGAGDDPDEDKFTVRVNVGMGGQVEVDGRTVLGGMGTNITVDSGEDIEFEVTAEDGYVLDLFRVNGKNVELTDGKYVLENITAATSVTISFKSEEQGDESDAIGVDDIDWNAKPIVVKVYGNKPVKREVLEKIATLNENGEFVEFRSDYGTIYIPCGKRAEGTSKTVNLWVSPLTRGILYDIIDTAIKTASGEDTLYKAFSFNVGMTLPEGTEVSFLAGAEFIGSEAVMLLFNSSDSTFFTKENAALPMQVDPDGVVGRFAYDNEGILICTKDVISSITITATALNEGGFINPEGVATVERDSTHTYYISSKDGYVIKQILVDDVVVEGVSGRKSYNHTFENIGKSHTIKVEFMSENGEDTDNEGNGTLTTVIVILIIVLVAIAGAAALFVVKWRQEKF